MEAERDREITRILRDAAGGDRRAHEELLPFVEVELRERARALLRRESKAQSIETNMLVDDAFVRLVAERDVTWANRAHFYRAAAICMRRILIDHAKRRRRQKRGGGALAVTLGQIAGPGALSADRLLAVDEALDRLAEQFPVQAEIVVLRIYGGRTVREIEAMLGIPRSTVDDHWQLAKAWLRRALG